MKFGPPSVKKVIFWAGVLCFGLLMTAMDCGYTPGPSDYSTGLQLAPQWSLDGSKIVFNPGGASIYAAASDGSRLWVVAKGKFDDEPKYFPGISPDGSKVAYSHLIDGSSRRLPRSEIKISGIDGSSKKTLAKHESSNSYPVWSPAGSRIAFSSVRNLDNGRSGNLFTMAPDGSDVKLLVTMLASTPAWSPDGNRLAFVSWLDETKADSPSYAYVVGIDGSGLTRIGPSVTRPTWSPDGREIAFIGAKEGAWTMYKARVDGSELTKVMDVDDPPGYSEPGQSLEWSPDGTQLLLSGGGTKVSVVNVDGSDLRRWGHQGVLFASWSPDGNRVAYMSWEPPSTGRQQKPDQNAVRLVLATANPDWSDTRAVVIEREGEPPRAAQPK